MTEREAKDIIQGKLDCMKKCDTFDCLNSDDCDECDYCYAQGTFGEQKEAFQIAINALEKQIPKKPNKSEKQVIRYVNTYYCPICKLGFTGTGVAKWCYHCGQKLDWSDEE